MNIGEIRNIEGCRNGYSRTDGERSPNPSSYDICKLNLCSGELT